MAWDWGCCIAVNTLAGMLALVPWEMAGDGSSTQVLCHPQRPGLNLGSWIHPCPAAAVANILGSELLDAESPSAFKIKDTQN